jgi:hypothetical protein
MLKSGYDYGILNLNEGSNLQVGLGAGLQWKKFMLKSGYDYGILNLNEGSNRKLYEGGWYVSFGYEF